MMETPMKERKIVVIKSNTGTWPTEKVTMISHGAQVDVFGIQKMPGVLTISPVISREKIAELVGHNEFTYETVDYKDRPF